MPWAWLGESLDFRAGLAPITTPLSGPRSPTAAPLPPPRLPPDPRNGE